MQISFDPYDSTERRAVRSLMDAIEARIEPADWPDVGAKPASLAAVQTVIADRVRHVVGATAPPAAASTDDRPDFGLAEFRASLAGVAVEPIPPHVAPAPSTAAAAASPTAPATAIPLPPASAPPAPTTAPAAVAPTVPAAPTSDASERDAQGLPWDGRIHSAGKTKNADGTWRQRRGTDPALVSRVLEELRGAVSAPPAPTSHPVDRLLAAVNAPTPPTVTVGPTFASLMSLVTPHLATGAVTAAELNASLSPLGVPTVVALTARPDLVPAADTALRALLAGKGLLV